MKHEQIPEATIRDVENLAAQKKHKLRPFERDGWFWVSNCSACGNVVTVRAGGAVVGQIGRKCSPRNPFRKITKRWKPKGAAPIRICDMGSDHIRNCIRMLERKTAVIKQSIPYPTFSGEMAQYYAEQEYERLMEAGPNDHFPIIHDLNHELSRREWERKHGNRLP